MDEPFGEYLRAGSFTGGFAVHQIKEQLLEMICPDRGQTQESIGRTWHFAVTLPVAVIAVQLVQREVTLALAGASRSITLKSMAPRLPNTRDFVFISRCSLSVVSVPGVLVREAARTQISR
ncbi:MAG TPA: hypothetical protein VHA33_08580, partial [Candidatus Angelobacter sp.]|nr:hypothetical protein [Candidatus Angelobacter sp.]